MTWLPTCTGRIHVQIKRLITSMDQEPVNLKMLSASRANTGISQRDQYQQKFYFYA
jgi:hypothetical protein